MESNESNKVITRMKGTDIYLKLLKRIQWRKKNEMNEMNETNEKK